MKESEDIVKPESQGRKTSILVFSIHSVCPPPTRRKFGKVVQWKTTTFKERQDLEEILKTKPSNGIVVLEKLKREYPKELVRIFGFDWKQTPTWYQPIVKFEHHDYEKEKEYCLNLIEEMKWEIYQ